MDQQQAARSQYSVAAGTVGASQELDHQDGGSGETSIAAGSFTMLSRAVIMFNLTIAAAMMPTAQSTIPQAFSAMPAFQQQALFRSLAPSPAAMSSVPPKMLLPKGLLIKQVDPTHPDVVALPPVS